MLIRIGNLERRCRVWYDEIMKRRIIAVTFLLLGIVVLVGMVAIFKRSLQTASAPKRSEQLQEESGGCIKFEYAPGKYTCLQSHPAY